MTDSPRDRVAALLEGAAEPGAFSAARTAPVGDLQLEVRGVGPIGLPVPQAQARQLCLLGRPARYGRGEQTLLDRRVRDTWEIPKSRVKIDRRRWDQTLVPVLERLGRDLGLPSGPRLRVELHSMLVYAPGQFFVEHQDSEKDDAMVGSLVVGLPSTFTGGALEVRHGGKTATYRGSKKALSFVAFYGDCRHQVKPVRSGYRVVLTYNLLLRDEPADSGIEADATLVDGVARCLEEHFVASGADRLVYLLDHEYTRRGLDRSRLKGADARRVAVLDAAAERAGCELALALTDVHETWSAYESEERERWYGRSRYSRWDDWDDDMGEEFESYEGDETGDYDLEELIDSEIKLDSWIVSRGGRPEKLGFTVLPDEVCASTPSNDLEPYSSEYEGYMGNWGNTLERWYHRGAVVVWPRNRAFAVRAEASPSWALDELATRTRKGELISAQEAAGTLAVFWGRAAARVEGTGFFAKALRTARVLDEPDLAAMLLRPFRLELLTTTHAKPLSALVDSYGEQWAGQLVAAWSANRRFQPYTGATLAEWIATMPRLCDALQEAGDAGTAAARLLLRESWSWLSQAMERALELPSPSRREQTLSELGPPVAAILDGASRVAATNLGDQVMQVMCRDEALVGCAITTLRTTPTTRWSAVGLDTIATHVLAALEARLARPSRASDDWSIELPAGCACELCGELRAFLRDPTRASFEWPLAKERRRHVHSRIDTAELPVKHQTRRVGRPYTLVLTKTAALFERETQQRHHDQQDLTWLKRNRSDRAARRRTDSR
jgi:2OG-Fe(II) oxygenase superfamily